MADKNNDERFFGVKLDPVLLRAMNIHCAILGIDKKDFIDTVLRSAVPEDCMEKAKESCNG